MKTTSRNASWSTTAYTCVIISDCVKCL